MISKQSNLQLSHVLYRVQNLHDAVEKLRNAGFIIEYGTKPEKAYNAFIWFEEGVFIEIYKSHKLSFLVKWLMKICGYKSVLKRMSKWEQTQQGWTEWSLESKENNLNAEKEILKQKNIPFTFYRAKRKDINNQTLKWQLVIPNMIDFPFIMSAYSFNPNPKQIKHPNGITGFSKLIVGTDNLDTTLLQELLPDQTDIVFINHKIGLQTVEFINSNKTIEEILQ